MKLFISQAEVIGNDRAPTKGSNLTKRTSVIMMVDENGDTRFTSGVNLGVAADELPKINAGDIGELTKYNAVAGPPLAAVKKKGVSVPHIDVEDEVKKRGGDKRFKICKPDSSFFLRRN